MNCLPFHLPHAVLFRTRWPLLYDVHRMVNIIKSINIFRVKYPLKWSYPKIWLHYDLNFAEITIFPNLDYTLCSNADKFRKVIRSFSNENAGVMVHGGGRIIL